ncbi:MAG: PilZ domain-containing protein [Thermoleophilia bacterium]
MTLFLARRGAGEPGPLPQPGADLWFEDLTGGPAASSVSEVREARLRVAPPTRDEQPVDVPDDRDLVVTYLAAQVPCEARVRAVPPGERDHAGLWLAVAKVERMQRRSAVRVQAQLLARVMGDGSDGALPETGEGGITEDMSAGGVLMRLGAALSVGTRVRLRVHVGGPAGDLDVVARVVRVEHDPLAARPYRTALSFPELTGEAETRLVRFLFERQRALRREATDQG